MDTDSDASSLLTLTASLRAGLYRYEGRRKFQGSNTDYRAYLCKLYSASGAHV